MVPEIIKLREDALRAAEFYENSPGLVSDPRVVPDLYRTIARLAKVIMELEKVT